MGHGPRSLALPWLAAALVVDLTSLPLASPVAVPAASVECVRRGLAGKHRPPIAPPIFSAGSYIKVGWKPPAPTVETVRLMHVLWLNFSTFVIDDDEMQTRRLEKARKLLNSRTLGVVLGAGDDVVSYASPHRELTLT
ncbi:MAG TPA: hypothetical protein VGL75_04260 [Acidothermaceae bacterium]